MLYRATIRMTKIILKAKTLAEAKREATALATPFDWITISEQVGDHWPPVACRMKTWTKVSDFDRRHGENV